MSIGLDVSKTQLDFVAGSIAKDLTVAMNRIEDFKLYLDGKSVGDLEALGYTTNEANVLKSAYADAAQLVTIFHGSTSLGNAKDFRTFLRQVWGLGGLT